MTASRRMRRDRAAGFLLTETLATFTISAFVLLGLVSASSVFLRNVDRSIEKIQDVDELGQTIKAIERDVAGLARARWNGYEPQGFVFQGGPNSLFFAQARRDADGSREMRVIALREIVAGRGTRLVRGEARLPARAAGFDALRFGSQRELGTGSTRLKFYYVPSRDAQGAPARLREWRTGRVLPAAIIVEAVTRDTGRVAFSTRVPIRSNADIGCLTQDDAGDQAGPSAAIGAASANTTTGIGTGSNLASAQTMPNGLAPGGGGMATPAAFCGREGSDKARGNRRDPASQPASSVLSPGSPR